MNKTHFTGNKGFWTTPTWPSGDAPHLTLSVPAFMRRRLLYFGAAFDSFTDLDAQFELRLAHTGATVATLKDRFAQQTQATLGTGYLSETGLPSFSCQAFDPTDTVNFEAPGAAADALQVMFNGNPTAGAKSDFYAVVCQPFTWLGELDTVELRVKNFTAAACSDGAFLGLFIGCKSFEE